MELQKELNKLIEQYKTFDELQNQSNNSFIEKLLKLGFEYDDVFTENYIDFYVYTYKQNNSMWEIIVGFVKPFSFDAISSSKEELELIIPKVEINYYGNDNDCDNHLLINLSEAMNFLKKTVFCKK